jgi:hypothetical protein
MRTPYRRLGLATLLAVLPMSTAIAQQLPQGLTCGLSYRDIYVIVPGALSFQYVPEDNPCNGTHTVEYVSGSAMCSPCDWCHCSSGCSADGSNQCLVSGYNWVNHAAPGYVAVMDGDYGNSNGQGYVHQELVSGETDPAKAPWLVLPQGAVCGFHHTINSPGHTCMGFNPALSFYGIFEGPPPPGQPPPPPALPGCPPGWAPHKAFDMSSNTGYWTWCEYLDPNHLSAGSPTVSAVGIACGMSHNWSSEKGSCMGYSTLTYASQAACPPGMAASHWTDYGQPSGIGLGFCTTTSNVLPAPAPLPPTSCPSGTTLCGSKCVDLNSSHSNCGACGFVCASTEACVDADCTCTGSKCLL